MKVTAQPGIWPGRNIGTADARTIDGDRITSACCLDCNWGSEWHTTLEETWQAGHDHVCGVTTTRWLPNTETEEDTRP